MRTVTALKGLQHSIRLGCLFFFFVFFPLIFFSLLFIFPPPWVALCVCVRGSERMRQCKQYNIFCNTQHVCRKSAIGINAINEQPRCKRDQWVRLLQICDNFSSLGIFWLNEGQISFAVKSSIPWLVISDFTPCWHALLCASLLHKLTGWNKALTLT